MRFITIETFARVLMGRLIGASPTTQGKKRQLSVRARRDLCEAISNAGVFDEKYYISKYHDVRDNRLMPLDHYVRFGVAERRQPNEWFEPQFYDQAFELDGLTGDAGLIHYVRT